MKEEFYDIETTEDFVTYCKTVSSPVKMNKRGAGIILDYYEKNDMVLSTDHSGTLYQSEVGGDHFETTLDDVVDQVCEWNYEDIEAAKKTARHENEYITKCRLYSRIEKMEREAYVLNRIFYQTKYGRNVNLLAERIAGEVMEQLGLVPVYDIPMYEDGIRKPDGVETERKEMQEKTGIEKEQGEPEELEHEVEAGQIVASVPVPKQEETADLGPVSESRGAR